jgi:hypothetical protein
MLSLVALQILSKGYFADLLFGVFCVYSDVFTFIIYKLFPIFTFCVIFRQHASVTEVPDLAGIISVAGILSVAQALYRCFSFFSFFSGSLAVASLPLQASLLLLLSLLLRLSLLYNSCIPCRRIFCCYVCAYTYWRFHFGY